MQWADVFHLTGRNTCHRSRADWAGVHAGDAYTHTVEAAVQWAARSRFLERVRNAQQAGFHAAMGRKPSAWTPAVKAQLTPCHADYPAASAVDAAVGLSAYLEFQFHVSANFLGAWCMLEGARLAQLVETSACSADIVRHVVTCCARAVETRLYTAQLAVIPGLREVEDYRVFLAAQQSFRFATMTEIVQAAVLFGDVLPPLRTIRLHPVAVALLGDLLDASETYDPTAILHAQKSLPDAGVGWVFLLSAAALAHITPEGVLCESRFIPSAADSLTDPSHACVDTPQAAEASHVKFAPTANPPHPVLDMDQGAQDKQSSIAQRIRAGHAPEAPQDEAQKSEHCIVHAFMESVKAAGDDAPWDRCRAEDLRRALVRSAYMPGPIEGQAETGAEHAVPLGSDVFHGPVLERNLETDCDNDALAALRQRAAPLARLIRRLLYRDGEQRSGMQRFQGSGSLDPGRLERAAYSDAVYRHRAVQEDREAKGSPVLVLAADASASLRRPELSMLKLLYAAWMLALEPRRLRTLACLYRGEELQPGMTGALIEWLLHPLKRPAADMAEALRALCGLQRGRGAQLDALSLRRIADDAFSLARGHTVYLVVLSDCRWNSSFRTKRSGTEEMRAMLAALRARHGRSLHVTLVALGDEGVRDIGADAVFHAPKEILRDETRAAAALSRFIAGLLSPRGGGSSRL